MERTIIDGGLSEARLARTGEVMGGDMERGEVPGVVTLVARRGEVHVHAAGTMAADASDPVGRDTLFRVTSMTKPIIAVAAMILVEGDRDLQPVERAAGDDGVLVVEGGEQAACPCAYGGEGVGLIGSAEELGEHRGRGCPVWVQGPAGRAGLHRR